MIQLSLICYSSKHSGQYLLQPEEMLEIERLDYFKTFFDNFDNFLTEFLFLRNG